MKTKSKTDFLEFKRLIKVIEALRHPSKGCPWDLKQSHQSLLKYLIEESFEFIAAAKSKKPKKMEEEIGDVLLQVLLHCQMGKERGDFDLESVARTLAEKLIRRHPHVFDSKFKKNIAAEEVVANWKEIKKLEKGKKHHHEIDLGYLKFPALFSANKIGEKTKTLRFDWKGPHEVLQKVEEEWQELKHELKKKNSRKKIREELGDFLFTVAQLARHLKMHPEEVLYDANQKFIKRFMQMEKMLHTHRLTWDDLNIPEMEKLWSKIKKREKHVKSKTK